MGKSKLLLKYFSHYFSAKSRRAIHSPLILKFIDNVVNAKNCTQELINIESVRNSLLRDNTTIEVSDLGTGSARFSNKYSKSIASIARNHLKSKKEARFLYNIAKFNKSQNILELGTSLGISTLYLSVANPTGKIITIEGSAETANIAESNFKKLNANNISLLVGSIDDNLDYALELFENKPDMVFFDANHRRKPTIDYFNRCLKYAHQKSIFIIDDIYFSEEMEIAWNEIISNESVTLSIDMFFFGIVFFDSGIVKQNVKLRI